MGKWISKKLVDLAKHLQSGGTPKSDNPEYYGGDIPFVSIEDMTASGKYLSKTIKTITNEGLKNSAAWQVPENAIMYSIYATLGLPVISRIPAATNQAILNIVVDDETTDVEFLYYHLLSLRGQIHKFSSQTTQSNLNAKIVKNFDLYLPEDKPEQTRIAQILSKADAAITQTEALIGKYQRIKTGLMQDLLTKGIDEQGKIRSEKTHRFKTENGLRVPEEWVVDCIDNLETAVLDFKANGSFETLTANVKYYYDQNYARLIRLTDLRNGLKLNGVFIDEKGFQFLKKTRLVEGDILIACVGEYTGFVCQMPKVPYQATIAPNMFVVRFQDNIVNSYAYRYMTSIQFQNQILVVSTSSATKLLNNPNLRSLLLAVPPRDEQIEIANKFDKIERLIDDYKTSLEKLKSLKTGLMQDLLSGSVRVKIKEEVYG